MNGLAQGAGPVMVIAGSPTSEVVEGATVSPLWNGNDSPIRRTTSPWRPRPPSLITFANTTGGLLGDLVYVRPQVAAETSTVTVTLTVKVTVTVEVSDATSGEHKRDSPTARPLWFANADQ